MMNALTSASYLQGETLLLSQEHVDEYTALLSSEDDMTDSTMDLLGRMRNLAIDLKNDSYNYLQELINGRKLDHAEIKESYNSSLDALRNSDNIEEDTDLFEAEAVNLLRNYSYSEKQIALRFTDIYREIKTDYLGSIDCNSPVFDEIQTIMGKEKNRIEKKRGMHQT